MPKSRLRLADLSFNPTVAQHMLAGDVPLSATPAEAHSLALPAAGSWFVEAYDGVEVASVGAARDISWSIGITNLTSMSLMAMLVRTSASVTVYTTQTAVGLLAVLTGMASNNRGRLIATGRVAVSAPSMITLTASISADAAQLKTGSLLRARRYA